MFKSLMLAGMLCLIMLTGCSGPSNVEFKNESGEPLENVTLRVADEDFVLGKVKAAEGVNQSINFKAESFEVSVLFSNGSTIKAGFSHKGKGAVLIKLLKGKEFFYRQASNSQ